MAMLGAAKIRRPVVAGAFYPGTAEGLRKEIEGCFLHRLGAGLPKGRSTVKVKEKLKGAVVPHAGYVYSGPCATHVYSRLGESFGEIKTAVILGPNHTGLGSGVSVSDADKWSTPLGEVEIDAELRKKILEASDIIDCEPVAHMQEHSIEVQLPFLQTVLKDFKFVPICMMLNDEKTCREVGEAIAKAAGSRKGTVILASSDMTHYEPAQSAQRKDQMAIDAVEELDPSKLLQTVFRENITMCGAAPAAAMLFATNKLGAKEGRLLKYYTSGDITGDSSSVVGYASMGIF